MNPSESAIQSNTRTTNTVADSSEDAQYEALPLAQVALPVPIDKAFSYAIPPAMQRDAQPGCRVLVPFGSRVLTGMIVGIIPESQLDKKTKHLIDVLDETPAFTQ
ncbi:MAG: hypothetical protein AB8G77_09145, partial [Rhodothermales bacterium]